MSPNRRPVRPSPHDAATIEQLTAALTLEQIAALDDPVLRNYLITHSYYRLSMQMVPLLGHDLSWVGFSSWVSELAGSCIRGEIVPLSRLDPLRVPSRIRAAVARGNQLVFAEIAPAFRDFARMMEWAPPTRLRAYERLARSRDHAQIGELVRDGLDLDPRPYDPRTQGQALLIAAFEQYFLAVFEPDEVCRARRVFAANFAIGLHEQQRLDPVIGEMLDVPVVNRGVKALLAGGRSVWRRVRRPAAPSAETLPRERRFRRRLSDRVQRVLSLAQEGRFTHAIGTQQVLSLPLQREVVSIGRDIPPPPGAGMFPPPLRRLDASYEDDARYQALTTLLLAWDRTPDTTQGSAADDWSSLADRMNFIVDLFRSRQQDPSLFASPLRALWRTQGEEALDEPLAVPA